jgi:3-oxoacyl-[acyl-carrier-protein] synthase III
MPLPGEESRWRKLVEECLRRELGERQTEVAPDEDLIEKGILDSMSWVALLRTLESAGGASDLGASLNDQPASINSMVQALGESQKHQSIGGSEKEYLHVDSAPSPNHVLLAGSGSAVGSRMIPSGDVDRAFGMTAGKLQKRAGIESLAYAAETEDELKLGARAAEQALHEARIAIQELDWVVATSETHHAFPSLASLFHSQLLARENCGALDVGGGCLGLLNALAVAHGLIASRQAGAILVITADVHSRVLMPQRVAGEFGGLFGDGASAFVLKAARLSRSENSYLFGKFFFGCAGQYASAIRVAESGKERLDVYFDGEALSRAAIGRLEKLLTALELRSGISRDSWRGVATHQPNPRLVALLAKQSGIASEKFPEVARRFGNLGPSTCGVALDLLLRAAVPASDSGQDSIFLASLGPGLLFGGTWLTPA